MIDHKKDKKKPITFQSWKVTANIHMHKLLGETVYTNPNPSVQDLRIAGQNKEGVGEMITRVQVS